MSAKVNLRDRIFVAIGECLHAWSVVELELSNLYMVFHRRSRAEVSHPFRAVFEAVISLEVRLVMLQAFALADADLGTDYPPHLKALCARVSKLYKKRHEIAHFMKVTRVGDDDTLWHGIKPFFTMDAFQRGRGTELSVEQIEERAASFHTLAMRVQRHVQHVGALLALPTEYYAQAGELAFPMLGPADLTPKPPPHPPQSSRG